MARLADLLARPVVAFRPEFVDLTEGDVVAALWLSQVVYWQARIGWGRWWFKSHVELARETRLSEKQSKRAKAVCEALGLIRTDVRGMPRTTWYVVDVDEIERRLAELEIDVAEAEPTSVPLGIPGADYSDPQGRLVGPTGPTSRTQRADKSDLEGRLKVPGGPTILNTTHEITHERREDSPEPPSASRTAKAEIEEPALVELPIRGGGSWPLTIKIAEELAEAFEVDVEDVVRFAKRAKAWLDANPGRRKTKRGMRRFLTSWIERDVNRYGSAAPASNVERAARIATMDTPIRRFVSATKGGDDGMA